MTRQSAAAEEKIGTITQRFEVFQVKFNEVSEMLVSHDTGQLKRVAAVERDTD